MPFNFLGTIRQCQWRSFRDWSLNERRAVAARLKVLDAEIHRIGRITVFYDTVRSEVQTPEGAVREIETVSEKRRAFQVSPGSSLEKLVQAYIAMGGNPMSISLWLQPDEIQFTTVEDPSESPDDNPNEQFTREGSESTPYDQPGGGIRAYESIDSYGVGGKPQGLTNSLTDVRRMSGRYFNQGSAGAKIAIRMDFARRWVQQEITELAHLENRIVKLMDLREQLSEERDNVIQQAVGGSVEDFINPPDADRFARNLHLTQIVSGMDGIFYETNENGEPDFTTINLGTNEGNGQVTPSGIALYDTLFADPEGTDPFAA